MTRGWGFLRISSPISSTAFIGLRSLSRQTRGTGLGLSIVKKLVELQGGSIHVTSKVGIATRVTIQFVLPMMQEDR